MSRAELLPKLSVLVGAILMMVASGCCSPMGCGPGCGTVGDHCYDCDGTRYDSQPIASTPIDSLRQMKRNLVCGSGCGETYYGEWRSTPPDACDPCAGDQFVGGATPCQPFCWQPGTLFGGLLGGIYGTRVCGDCGEYVDDCGCGAGFVDDGMIIDGGTVMEGGGCSTCSTRNQVGTRMARQQPRSSAILADRTRMNAPMQASSNRNVVRRPVNRTALRTSTRDTGSMLRR